MNSLLNHNDDDIEDSHRGRKPDREITLGTTLVLGIFFALAVFGAVMFGFGYSIGGKHAAATAAVAEGNPNATFNGFKPPSGHAVADTGKQPAPATVTVPLTTPPPYQAKSAPSASPASDDGAESEPVRTATALPAVALPAAMRAAAPVAASVPVAAPAGQFMVQVAAVSHQEDADTVATTLKRKGYAVAVRHEPADQLLHVQVGPFATRKEADAMRQRILADGFNAIVKESGR